MTKQYKIVANGVTEIVEADCVELFPQIGQIVFKITEPDGNKILHIAPASALVTTVNKIEILSKIFNKIEDIFIDYKSRVPHIEVLFELEEKIQLIQLEYIAEYENH